MECIEWVEAGTRYFFVGTAIVLAIVGHVQRVPLAPAMQRFQKASLCNMIHKGGAMDEISQA